MLASWPMYERYLFYNWWGKNWVFSDCSKEKTHPICPGEDFVPERVNVDYKGGETGRDD